MFCSLSKYEVHRSETRSITDPSDSTNSQQMKVLRLAGLEACPTEEKTCLKSPRAVRQNALTLPFSMDFIAFFQATVETKHLKYQVWIAKSPNLIDSRHPVTRLFLRPAQKQLSTRRTLLEGIGAATVCHR